MGNGCTKHIQRLNKNSVAPNHKSNSQITSNASHPTSTKPHLNRPANTNDIPKKRSTNPFEEDTSDTDSFILSEPLPSTSYASAEPSIHSKSRTLAAPLSHEHRTQLNRLTSPIDTNSIIFDKADKLGPNTIKSSQPPRLTQFVRSCSFDSSSDKINQNEKKPFSSNIHRMFQSNMNISSITLSAKNENSLKLTKLYHRLSGSVHSLFNGNLNNNRKRNLSASDTNLNLSKMNGRCGMSQQQLIDNDYCPSVLYNRKERKTCNEKKKSKHPFWPIVFRKKSDPTTTRKS